MKRTAFVPHNEFYINHIRTDKKYDMPVQHYHDSYEIYFQTEGTRYLFYDNICYTLKRGDVTVLRPFEIHYAQSREALLYERYVINFSKEFFGEILSSDELFFLFEKCHFGVIHLSEEQTKEVIGFFDRIDRYETSSRFLAKKLLSMEVLQLLCLLMNYSEQISLASETSIHPAVKTSIEFINSHYRDNPSLDDVCTAAGMSKYHFCHLFKKVTGATIMEYLNNVRLTKVHSLLSNSDYSLDEIADECGFSNAVNLSRAFKKTYNMSPSRFRRNFSHE